MQSKGQGYIYHKAEVTYATLAGLLASGPRWAYVEQLNAAAFEKCDASLLQTWSHGRAFGAAQTEFTPDTPCGMEVRWQSCVHDKALYQVEVLTEDPQWQPPEADWQRRHPQINGLRSRELLLWGEMGKAPREDPTWIEIRIPQPLKYPLEVKSASDDGAPAGASAGRLRVLLLGYDYTINAVPVTTRWAWLRQGA